MSTQLDARGTTHLSAPSTCLVTRSGSRPSSSLHLPPPFVTIRQEEEMQVFSEEDEGCWEWDRAHDWSQGVEMSPESGRRDLILQA